MVVVGTGSGDPSDHTPDGSATRPAYHGLALGILRRFSEMRKVKDALAHVNIVHALSGVLEKAFVQRIHSDVFFQTFNLCLLFLSHHTCDTKSITMVTLTTAFAASTHQTPADQQTPADFGRPLRSVPGAAAAGSSVLVTATCSGLTASNTLELKVVASYFAFPRL